MIPELSQLNYEEGLCRTNLVSLEMRRLRAGLIEVFKIVKGIDNVHQCSFFQPSSETRTRGHMFTFLFDQTVDIMLEHFHLVRELFQN